jgi:hypothetical protein
MRPSSLSSSTPTCRLVHGDTVGIPEVLQAVPYRLQPDSLHSMPASSPANFVRSAMPLCSLIHLLSANFPTQRCEGGGALNSIVFNMSSMHAPVIIGILSWQTVAWSHLIHVLCTAPDRDLLFVAGEGATHIDGQLRSVASAHGSLNFYSSTFLLSNELHNNAAAVRPFVSCQNIRPSYCAFVRSCLV